MKRTSKLEHWCAVNGGIAGWLTSPEVTYNGNQFERGLIYGGTFKYPTEH
jgi:hypothetical protein